MIDIEIQISISERSSGWAINYSGPGPSSGQLISLFYEESLRRASFKKFCHQIAPTIKRAGCNFVHQPRKIQILGGISVSDIAVNWERKWDLQNKHCSRNYLQCTASEICEAGPGQGRQNFGFWISQQTQWAASKHQHHLYLDAFQCM